MISNAQSFRRHVPQQSRWLKSKEIRSLDTSLQTTTRERKNSSSKKIISRATSVQIMNAVISFTVINVEQSSFKTAAKKIIGLLRIARLLKSRDRNLVLFGLKKVHQLIKDPQNAAIVEDVGICDLLVNLLSLDPIAHWTIVGSSLRALHTIVIYSQCSNAIVGKSSFIHTMDTLLKSDEPAIQYLCASIITRAFMVPPYDEDKVVKNAAMRQLLFRCLKLPFQNIILTVLKILEEYSYHCPNTAYLFGCNDESDDNVEEFKSTNLMGDDDDVDGIQVLLDFLTRGAEEAYRFPALNVLRNVVLAISHEPSVALAVMKHAGHIEQAVLRVCNIPHNTTQYHTIPNHTTQYQTISYHTTLQLYMTHSDM